MLMLSSACHIKCQIYFDISVKVWKTWLGSKAQVNKVPLLHSIFLSPFTLSHAYFSKHVHLSLPFWLLYLHPFSILVQRWPCKTEEEIKKVILKRFYSVPCSWASQFPKWCSYPVKMYQGHFGSKCLAHRWLESNWFWGSHHNFFYHEINRVGLPAECTFKYFYL